MIAVCFGIIAICLCVLCYLKRGTKDPMFAPRPERPEQAEEEREVPRVHNKNR